MSEVKSVDIRSLIDSYEFPCKLPGTDQELLIKPITTGQMKKILAYENETDYFIVEEALDKLVSDCVLTEGFNIDDLYLQDRFFLLLEIRKITKGSSYSFNFKCPKCEVDNLKSFSLDDLVIKDKVVSDYIIKINDGLKLEVDFPTRRNQKDAIIDANERGLKDKEREIEVITSTFAGCIKKAHTKNDVIDEISFSDKIYLLDNITSGKFDEFKSWFEENEFGVDFEILVGCAHCDFEDKQKIPLSDFFV